MTLRVKCSMVYHFLSLSHDNDDVKYMNFIVLYEIWKRKYWCFNIYECN